MPASAKSVGLFGAFERHNFGDWLMAYVASELTPEITNDWLFESPSLGYGMHPECGSFVQLSEYLAGSQNPTVIHVGGETLACSSDYAAFMNGLEEATSNRPLHYVLPQYFDGVEIDRTFFAVGALGVPNLSKTEKQYLLEALSSSRFLSVRDRVSQENLEHLGLNSRLFPCIVSLLPRFLDKAGRPSSRKLVFQASQAFLTRNSEAVAYQISQLSAGFDEVALVAAGVAPGHDSLISFIRMRDQMEEQARAKTSVFLSLNPLDIASEIGEASLVVATSLHFRILSMAYGVPRLSLETPKALAFAETWDAEPYFSSSHDDLIEKGQHSMTASAVALEKVSNKLQSEAFRGWLEMLSAIGVSRG